MLKKIIKLVMLAVIILNGLLFISNIYVLGDREAAIKMHDDLPRVASAAWANTKVIVCFVVGILYLLSAYGIIRTKRNFTLAGILGFIIFDGVYLIQLIMWAGIHPRIWIDFSTFGGVSFLIGMYSLYYWKKGN